MGMRFFSPGSYPVGEASIPLPFIKEDIVVPPK